MTKAATLLIALLISNMAFAKQKYYKWTDENGSIQYSLEKPKNNQTDEINISTNQPIVPQETTGKLQQEPADKSYMEKHYEKKKKAEQIAKDNRKHCLQAQQTITKYQQQVRMSRIDKNTGETIYLDDSKRENIINQAQQAVAKYCH